MRLRSECCRKLILELLSEVSEVPAGLANRIRKITETGDLKVLHKNASKAETIEEFEKDVRRTPCKDFL